MPHMLWIGIHARQFAEEPVELRHVKRMTSGNNGHPNCPRIAAPLGSLPPRAETPASPAANRN